MIAARTSPPDPHGERKDTPACNEVVFDQCLMNCLALCNGPTDTGKAGSNFGEKSSKLSEQKSKARRAIFLAGERIAGVPYICSGWAAKVSNSESSGRQIVSFLLPGDLVSGALLFEESLNVTVEAITDVTYRTFDRVQLRTALAANPELYESILKSWSEENEQIIQLVVSLGRCTAEERIVQLIIRLADRLARRGLVKNNTFYFPLRQWHIAEALGLTSVHVNKVIRRLSSAGLIHIHNRSLTMQNPDQLRRMCRI